ncbi:unnamed protein product [Somion occarium]|uniref:BPL/LPL catalytic domain-containing protein n=1 Tax=Somion occarium TaxID=3059160 RepID=A0ABP1DP30_9APHY
MNVLVYAGPEVLQTSLARSITLLKSLLSPNYTVQPISVQSLSSHPWAATCALLVIPGCSQRLSFSPSTASTIKSYVENGGAFLGLRVGAKTGWSESTLRFQDEASGASLSCHFSPGGEEPKTITLMSSQGESPVVHVLARYSEDSKPAAVNFKASRGNVVLWAVPIEVPLVSQDISDVHIDVAERRRLGLVRETLRLLGLYLPADSPSVAMQLLPLVLTGSPSRPGVVRQILDALEIQIAGKLADANDTFEFVDTQHGLERLHRARSQLLPKDVKPVIVFLDGTSPQLEDTPLFNIPQYYTDLSAARQQAGCPSNPVPWGVGEALLYGEVVTSTQTMLDKNPRLLSSLPVPFLSLASHQLAGRGRGGNTWVSPTGCLQFSLLLRVPLSQLPATKLVFVQYLFALAVVEACRHDNIMGRSGEAVRLKWPNDIYIVDGEQKRKVGGILVHTSFVGGLVSIVIGCGVNVLNGPPIASLAQVLSTEAHWKLNLERTAATIMATFEPMWNTFVSEHGSFSSFMDLYLERWLHSDQLVTITTTTPPRHVRVTGITADHGLLRTIPERDAWVSRASGSDDFIDLQPDGNTFDLMSGLIMTTK